jgi:hypothetical protein
MEGSRKVIITFIVLILLIAGFYISTKWLSSTTGFAVGEDEKVVIARCLSGKNVSLYSSAFSADSYQQKKGFGTAYRFLNVIDCDKSDHLCENMTLEELPIWDINGQRLSGFMTFDELKNVSGC